MNLNLTDAYESTLLCDVLDEQAGCYEKLAEQLDADNPVCDAAQRAMKSLRAAKQAVKQVYEVYNSAQQTATGN